LISFYLSLEILTELTNASSQVVGDGMDPRITPVSAIMTPNPMVTRDTTSATEALQTMVTRGFRHLVSFSLPIA
jgi:CBS domain-containing protein